MSLKDYKYEVDENLVILIRLLQDSDLEGVGKPYGAEPTTPVSHDFHALLSRNAKQFGIRPRSCIWEAKKQLKDSDKIITLRIEFPVLSIASYNSIITVTQERSNFTKDGITYYAKTLKQQKFV